MASCIVNSWDIKQINRWNIKQWIELVQVILALDPLTSSAGSGVNAHVCFPTTAMAAYTHDTEPN